MEKYCITLQQAKRLEELGASTKFDLKSQYWWIEWAFDDDPFLTDSNSIINDSTGKTPAYHVGELGEILHDSYSDIIYKSLNRWFFKSWVPQATNLNLQGEWPTEAQARGALLIYLLENNLI